MEYIFMFSYVYILWVNLTPPRTTLYPQAEYQEFANRHSLYYPTAIPSTLHPSFPHCSPVVPTHAGTHMQATIVRPRIEFRAGSELVEEHPIPALLPRHSRIPPVIPAKAGIHEAAGEATQPLSLEG